MEGLNSKNYITSVSSLIKRNCPVNIIPLVIWQNRMCVQSIGLCKTIKGCIGCPYQTKHFLSGVDIPHLFGH